MYSRDITFGRRGTLASTTTFFVLTLYNFSCTIAWFGAAVSAGSEDKMYFRDMTFGRHGAIDSTMAFFVLLISYNLQHLIEARGGKMRLRDADNLQRLLDAKRGAMFIKGVLKEALRL